MFNLCSVIPFALLVVSIHYQGVTSKDVTEKNAVVTLVTGHSSGYTSGAIALGQSLIDVGSKLRRVVMVTPDVDRKSRNSMKQIWEVVEVQPIPCNYQNNLDPTQFDLKNSQYQAGIKRWSATCTKFAAFTLTQFERIIFMDSDTLVVAPVDDAIYGFSNASFLAAPDSFPPDNFNSGFLVLNPSKEGYANIMRLNKEVGSAEGGDQGVFNNGLCPNWHTAVPEDTDCGRLPFIFNVAAAHYDKYSTLRKMSKLREPAVVHFVSDGKPWSILMLEYSGGIGEMSSASSAMLREQIVPHLLWRKAFFKATGEVPSNNAVLLGSLTQTNTESSKTVSKKEKTVKPSADKNTKNEVIEREKRVQDTVKSRRKNRLLNKSQKSNRGKKQDRRTRRDRRRNKKDGL